MKILVFCFKLFHIGFKDFTNTVEKMDIKSLAENDEQEIVRDVHEFFSDYLALGHHVFSMNIPKCGEVF